MDAQLAAVHEAGHAVMQWFVGWEIKSVKMKVNGSEASEPVSECPHPDPKTIAAVRKRLVVLFAGAAATQKTWPGSSNNMKDWHDMRFTLTRHLYSGGGTLNWNPQDGMSLRDPAASEILEDARAKCDEIIAHESIRAAIDLTADSIKAALADQSGVKRLDGTDVVKICEKQVGESFRKSNPWTAWLEGRG